MVTKCCDRNYSRNLVLTTRNFVEISRKCSVISRNFAVRNFVDHPTQEAYFQFQALENDDKGLSFPPRIVILWMARRTPPPLVAHKDTVARNTVKGIVSRKFAMLLLIPLDR
jgi:hypothetical protein